MLTTSPQQRRSRRYGRNSGSRMLHGTVFDVIAVAAAVYWVFSSFTPAVGTALFVLRVLGSLSLAVCFWSAFNCSFITTAANEMSTVPWRAPSFLVLCTRRPHALCALLHSLWTALPRLCPPEPRRSISVLFQQLFYFGFLSGHEGPWARKAPHARRTFCRCCRLLGGLHLAILVECSLPLLEPLLPHSSMPSRLVPRLVHVLLQLLQCRASLGTTTVDFTLFTRSFTCCVCV